MVGSLNLLYKKVFEGYPWPPKIIAKWNEFDYFEMGTTLHRKHEWANYSSKKVRKFRITIEEIKCVSFSKEK